MNTQFTCNQRFPLFFVLFLACNDYHTLFTIPDVRGRKRRGLNLPFTMFNTFCSIFSFSYGVGVGKTLHWSISNDLHIYLILTHVVHYSMKICVQRFFRDSIICQYLSFRVLLFSFDIFLQTPRVKNVPSASYLVVSK